MGKCVKFDKCIIFSSLHLEFKCFWTTYSLFLAKGLFVMFEYCEFAYVSPRMGPSFLDI